ncbi:MAG: type III-A CRISPR-associated RAMP protein Csm3 [Candidatus Bipolaricaulota bacterium]|nr:type III-A CRISPR-associated RAMP protein Csm3 [Candidatus Bipolaricaulota bacterium]MCX7844906.1 type III-A CRISPR-associated RAMP protein Csm3 [Candidatus Bipolaricaulota bacterium]MDW8151807.1 type III-A CRISPR-associated RAMP protein Csm3 [Candidatus Bipolaricaulota bacterium]
MRNGLVVRGRVFVEYRLRAVTGLRIGGSAAGIAIGGLDNPVIRDPLTNRPYVPGSSLKGKLRSLLEKQYGKVPNWRIHLGYIHVCEEGEEYRNCPVCTVFGVPAEMKKYTSTPTRLLVRDLHLGEDSAKALDGLSLDRPYTEIKTEVAIDRITSQANPRQVERVPAGAVFGPGEFVYTIYAGEGLVDPRKDVERLATVFEGMSLLEHDYLGGMGSRGSGKVRFENIRIALRAGQDYFAKATLIAEVPNVEALLAQTDEILAKIRAHLGL